MATARDHALTEKASLSRICFLILVVAALAGSFASKHPCGEFTLRRIDGASCSGFIKRWHVGATAIFARPSDDRCRG
jgi:hypothetical protein